MLDADRTPEQELQHLRGLVSELLDQIQSLQSKNAWLMHRLQLALRERYGRKSEKVDEQQLAIAFAETQAAEDAGRVGPPPFAHEAPDAEEPPRRKQGRPRAHPGRLPIPAHLPRERIEIEPESLLCPCCQEPLRRLGEEISEELGRQPARFFVRQYVRIKYACPRCQDQIVRPLLPARPIARGLAGADVVSDVLVGKFDDHLPLHRLAGIYKREGVPLDKATLCDWVAHSAELLAPIVAEMRRQILGGTVVQADETPVQYLDPAARNASHRGYLWAYVGEREDVVYDFTTTRAQAEPNRFLAGYQGYLQADGYSGYNEVLAWPGVTGVACWAHVRRKFFEARDTAPAYAAAALLAIRELYAIEAQAREQDLDVAAVAERRQARAGPVLSDLDGYVKSLLPQALPKSPLGRAAAYTAERWPALCRYLQDGRLSIDNNSVERAMRRVAVGRKNWLFAGSPAGGERAATIYSLLETCRRHQINPHEYLTDVLVRIDTHLQSRIAELTPRGWLAARANA